MEGQEEASSGEPPLPPVTLEAVFRPSLQMWGLSSKRCGASKRQSQDLQPKLLSSKTHTAFLWQTHILAEASGCYE